MNNKNKQSGEQLNGGKPTGKLQPGGMAAQTPLKHAARQENRPNKGGNKSQNGSAKNGAANNNSAKKKDKKQKMQPKQPQNAQQKPQRAQKASKNAQKREQSGNSKQNNGKKELSFLSGGNVQNYAVQTNTPSAAYSKMQIGSEVMRHNNAKRKSKLKVMFLGGVGEIGKNMTLFEYGDSIVVIDVGLAFPGSDMPGVDVVIPDFSYLIAHQDKLKGVLLTHGHEDHIGGVAFLVEKLQKKVNLYGTKLTLGLVENKLIEHDVQNKVNFVPVGDKTIVPLGEFSAEFVHVSHSVAGSLAICLRTPVGAVFHTGDFKIDYTPLGNEIMNLNRIAEIGKEGVLLLMSESTNVEKPGYTMSESVVRETINKVFQDAKGRRIIIATFASNVDRLGMIMELARQYKRKIAVAGKSMVKYIETAVRVGQMTVDESLFVDIDKVSGVEDGKLVILSTGSQGEPMSSLTRMASGEFNKVQIGSNDTIVISATPIPGNEKDVYNVINNLYRLGAVVVYSALQAVHVSGHACQEELKLVYTLIKPKYFIPVHGEYRHLKQHEMLVCKLGHKQSSVIIPEVGDCIEVDANTFKITGQVESGNVMVDGLGVGDVGNIVLKDRLSLAEDGIFICVVGIDRRNGVVASGPEIVSRGCIFAGDSAHENPLDELKKQIFAELAASDLYADGVSTLKTNIQRLVRRYFRSKYKRNPMVLPIILEV